MIALNYSRQAVGQLGTQIEPMREAGLDKTADTTEWCRFMLHMAVKFQLPDYGNLFDHGHLTRTEAEAFRGLPYGVVAAEYQAPVQHTEGSPYRALACPKRIALAVDSKMLPEGFWDGEEPGAAIFAISHFDDGWSLCPWTIGVFYDSAFHTEPSTIRNDPSAASLIADAGFSVTPTGWVLRQWGGTLGDSAAVRDYVRESNLDSKGVIEADVGSERDVIIHMVAALSCSNVEVEKCPVPAALARDCAKKGRSPFYEYHVLVLPARGEGGEGNGGTHAPPRLHLRRGHIRELHGSKRHVWVNACLVGKSPGLIDKDYRIEKGAPAQ